MTPKNKTKIDNLIHEMAYLNHSQEILETDNLDHDLGLDSLDRVELVIEIESMFDIQIPDSQVENLSTVKNIYDVVDEFVK